MMKKQMLFTVLMVGCVTAFASQEAHSGVKKQETALRIDLYGYGYEDSTGELNGIDIWNWMDGNNNAQMPEDKEVLIVETGLNGGFLPVTKLSDLRCHELKKCHVAIRDYGHLGLKYYGNKEDRDETHWNFVNQIKKGQCVLCSDNNNTTIVTKARGNPQEICSKLMAWQQTMQNEKDAGK